MKTTFALAFVLGLAFAQQANACEWMKQAAKPATVVTCEDGTCTAEQTQAEAATAGASPTNTSASDDKLAAAASRSSTLRRINL